MPDTVEEFLSNFPAGIRAIVAELRNMARNVMRGAHEFLYYNAINYSLDDSPLGRVCYLLPAENYVTVGFLHGAELNDQHHILQGGGKRARHLKIKSIAEARNSGLKDLVKIAWNHGTHPTRMKNKRPH